MRGACFAETGLERHYIICRQSNIPGMGDACIRLGRRPAGNDHFASASDGFPSIRSLGCRRGTFETAKPPEDICPRDRRCFAVIGRAFVARAGKIIAPVIADPAVGDHHGNNLGIVHKVPFPPRSMGARLSRVYSVRKGRQVIGAGNAQRSRRLLSLRRQWSRQGHRGDLSCDALASIYLCILE